MFATLFTLSFALCATAFPVFSNTTTPIILRDSCTPGSVICLSDTIFALCNPGVPLIGQPVAAGMVCFEYQGKFAATANTATSSSSAQPAYTPNSSAMSSTAIATTYTPVLPNRPANSSSVFISYAPTSTASSVSTVVSTTQPASNMSAPASSSTATSSNAASTSQPAATSTAGAAPVSTGTGISYTGDGSNWPGMNSWLSFDQMWGKNVPAMKISCSQFDESNNSDDEISSIKSAIQSVAQSSNIDPRFVLAIMMQESKGCVRVPTTKYSVANPGLLQCYAGQASCNTAIWSSGAMVTPGTAQNPCPSNMITNMITEGVKGTAASSSVGLAPLFATVGKTTAQGFYMTARKYNSGSIPADGNLSEGGSTSSYASDVANRLIGAM
ncbi:hypothetical protein LTR62_008255 [Meristemomyces frigidus]|uniref:Transglycosylase SLT domain-containing protein n=1 Tax=Meristemomyces frigidus TaxID=1508187 RepID=A0AAN7TAW6_9PEZI|nr:hypothetical protein LTR62_008255 [Meristemomyces frigidus]